MASRSSLFDEGDDLPFGAHLREAREAAAMSQVELASAAGISTAYVSQLETGLKTNPSDAVRVKLLTALGELPANPVGSAASRRAGTGGAGPTAPTVERAAALRAGIDPGDTVLPVGFLPPETICHVWPQAVGMAEGGRLWIDPRAAALPSGVPDRDPRVCRGPDGALWVDLGELAVTTPVDTRAPEIHTVPVVNAIALPGDAVPFEQYEQTQLRIEGGDADWVVNPAEPGVAEGPFPAHVGVIHVLTAANPDRRLLGEADNDLRNAVLQRDLDLAGIDVVPATTAAPDVPNAPVEPSFALFDQPRAEVLSLARRHGQTSLFEWTRADRSVITVDGRAFVHGWTSTTSS